MKYFVWKNNEKIGPLEEEVVAEGLGAREYSLHNLGIHEGMTEWTSLGILFPSFKLAALLANATQKIRISTGATILLTIIMLYMDKPRIGNQTLWWGYTQMFVMIALHIVGLWFLNTASKTHSVKSAITGLLPGAIWNVGVTVISISYVIARKPSPGGAIAGLLLLDYWWVSNLYRIYKFKTRSEDKTYEISALRPGEN